MKRDERSAHTRLFKNSKMRIYKTAVRGIRTYAAKTKTDKSKTQQLVREQQKQEFYEPSTKKPCMVEYDMKT